jgi:hypothetical protein
MAAAPESTDQHLPAEQQSKAGLEATAFHEAYPGHHTQFTIAQERTDLHAISRYFFLSGYGEGWALYTERLADEMGLYGSDLDRLGMLSNEAWRAARLVVDPAFTAGLSGAGAGLHGRPTPIHANSMPRKSIKIAVPVSHFHMLGHWKSAACGTGRGRAG